MFGRVNIVTATHDNTLVVPRVALLSEDGTAAVYVVAGGRVARKSVQVGFTGDGRSEILQGLAAGDQVITLGQNAVREGSLVEVVNAAKAVELAKPVVTKPESAKPEVAAAPAGEPATAK